MMDADTERLVVLAPARYVLLPLANLITGYSVKAMERKIEAGAQFFQSQANYDTDDFGAFLEKAQALKTPVLGGILVLHTAEIAQFIHENIPGIRLPDSVLRRGR